MKNLFYHFLLINILLLGVPKDIMACGPEMDERSFSLFFNPYDGGSINSIKRNYLYNPYHLTYDYGGSYEVKSEKEQNLEEWAKALNIENNAALKDFVYGNHIAYLNQLLKAKKSKKSFKNATNGVHNSIYNKLYQNKDYLEYFILIHDYSHNVNSYSDEWLYAYHVNKADSFKLTTNLKKSQEIYKSLDRKKDELSLIFKTRLAYHLVRAAHFNKKYEQANKYFNTYAKPVLTNVESSIVQEWLAGIRGGMLSRLQRKQEAFFWFARKFNRGTSSVGQAYIDLKWLSNDFDTKQVLTLAKIKQDSLDIYAAISATSVELKSTYLNNTISNIDDETTSFFMWYRELQKVEETYYHPMNCEHTKYRWDDYATYLDEHPQDIQTNYKAFKKLTLKLHKKAKLLEYKEHYTNALAYISLLDNNFDKASTYLNSNFTLEETKNQNLVLKLYKQTQLNSHLNQNQLTKLLNLWRNNYQGSYVRVDVVQYLLRDFIAPHYYYKQNDTLGAFTLWGFANYDLNQRKDIQIATSEVTQYFMNYSLNTDEFLSIKNQLVEKRHPILQWANNNDISISIGGYTSFLFYKYVRDENWLAAKKKVSNSDKTYYSPFIMHYDGYYSPTSIDSSRPMLNTEEFFTLGEELKKKVEANPSGQNHLNYGMYLFSTSFPGHNSISDDGSLGNYSTFNNAEYYYYETLQTPTYWGEIEKSYSFTADKDAIDYYYCFKAEDHLKKALDLLEKDEVKAMCCFLLARCYQTRCPEPKMKKNESGYMVESQTIYKGKEYYIHDLYQKQNPYLGQLRQDFSHTKTYKEAYSMCNNLRHYLD
ncbi:MAG: hypothetical protein COA58_00365 [Bacteroidetes bacterium]|nr:MAG: hypothetical protein COA58_00365 [Bacteroidota bacterium]